MNPEPPASVPEEIRRTGSFQRWYAAQHEAGNSVREAELLWALRVDPDRRPLLWAMRVAVRVAAEGRVKDNEVIIARPDASAVALYQPAATLDDSVVVLIREFRSTASTQDGFIHELPGGSGEAGDERGQAVEELSEETGFRIEPGRLVDHGSRQAAGTLSTHHVHLFSARIDDAELAHIAALQDHAHGDGQERTWIEVTTFGQVRETRSVDWTTLGMLAQVLLGDSSPGAGQLQGQIELRSRR